MAAATERRPPLVREPPPGGAYPRARDRAGRGPQSPCPCLARPFPRQPPRTAVALPPARVARGPGHGREPPGRSSRLAAAGCRMGRLAAATAMHTRTMGHRDRLRRVLAGAALIAVLRFRPAGRRPVAPCPPVPAVAARRRPGSRAGREPGSPAPARRARGSAWPVRSAPHRRSEPG